MLKLFYLFGKENHSLQQLTPACQLIYSKKNNVRWHIHQKSAYHSASSKIAGRHSVHSSLGLSGLNNVILLVIPRYLHRFVSFFPNALEC